MALSKYLFLLLLLFVILLLPILWKASRAYATRATTPTARVQVANLVLGPTRAWALRTIFRTPTMENQQNRQRGPSDSASRWRTLISESEAALEKYLYPRIDIDLAVFVRCVTFRVFVVAFLDVDPGPLVLDRVRQVTEGIWEFYSDAGGHSTLSAGAQRILYEWVPRRRFDTSTLHRILPAYEALWRIVATMVVDCEDDETRALRWLMLDFRDNPRDRQYSAAFGTDGRSVSAIMDDVAGRFTPIVRPQHQATSSNWPLGSIQYAVPSRATDVQQPTVQEALKFGALLASMIVGRVGVHYNISRPDGITGPQTQSPWDRRRISEVNNSPGHVTINTVEVHAHARTTRQAH